MTDSMIDAKSMTREADGISRLLASGKYSAEEMITIYAESAPRSGWKWILPLLAPPILAPESSSGTSRTETGRDDEQAPAS